MAFIGSSDNTERLHYADKDELQLATRAGT